MDKNLLVIMILFWLLGLSLSDVRYRRVPVWMILLGGAAIAGYGIYECVCGRNSFAVILSGMIPGTVLLMLAAGTQKVGWADGIVLMLLGCVLGIWQCILTVMFSLIMISILSVVLLVMKKADKGTRIPYIPFLAIGFVISRINYTA